MARALLSGGRRARAGRAQASNEEHFMRTISRISLTAFAVALAACGLGDPRDAAPEGDVRAAKGAVTVANLSLSLGTVASNEHCAFNVAAFNAAHAGVNLAANRQIRIWRTGAGHLGACTVENDGSLGADEVHMDADGFDRVEGDSSQTVTVSIDTVVASTAYPYSATTPPKTAAKNDQEFFEWRRNSAQAIPAAATIVAIAPHGGGIEQATAEQAREGFYDALPAGRVVDWEAYGYNDSADDINAFDHWHITSTDIAVESFPLLGALVARQFPYAISFHGFGQKDYSAWGKHIFVGGGESTLFRREITDVLNTLPASIGATAIYRNIPGGMDGDDPDNIVNRFNGAHRGIQLEQAWNLRGLSGSTDHSTEIAQKVASVYACLTDTGVSMAEDACATTMTASGSASSAACGRFVADKVVPPWYGSDFTLRASLDVAALSQADCDTVKGYASIYKLEGGRFERRAGGSVVGVWSGGQCSTAVAAGDDASIDAFITDSFTASPPATGQDTYRITVGGTYGSGAALTGVATLTRAAAPPADCCNTAADCAVVVDACSCTCLGVPVGGSAPTCHDPMSCVVSPCLGVSPVCDAGRCSAGASEY
jgi:phage replication-related protein YjqB (UPF0714/DUF867 family)